MLPMLSAGQNRLVLTLHPARYDCSPAMRAANSDTTLAGRSTRRRGKHA